MTTWIDILVEQKSCVLTAADVWKQAMTDINHDNQYFAVGVGFPVGSFLEGFRDKFGFYGVNSGLMVRKEGKFIVVAQNGLSYSNYVARIVGEDGYRDGKFSFAGDTYQDYRYAQGVNGSGIEELIKGFDVTRHTQGVSYNERSRSGIRRTRVDFL